MVIIVDDGTDSLAQTVNELLRLRGFGAYLVPVGRLATCRVAVTPREAFIEGQPVRGVLFRARPDAQFSEEFIKEDRFFCTSEARALWLEMLQLHTLTVVNRPDGELWYSSSEWCVWRRRLRARGVPVAELAAGDVSAGDGWSWLPWGGGVLPSPVPEIRRMFGAAITRSKVFNRSSWCYGRVMSDCNRPVVRDAIAVLEDWGIRLGALLTDASDRVVSCTAYPTIPDVLVRDVALRVTEALGASLHNR